LDAGAVAAVVARGMPQEATNKAMTLQNAIEIHEYFLGKSGAPAQ
jgi:hypothetical protein